MIIRKGALLTCGILFAIGAASFYFCRIIGLVELLIVGRFIVGLSSGITTAVLGMYLSEIPPSELRGTLAVFSGLGLYWMIQINYDKVLMLQKINQKHLTSLKIYFISVSCALSTPESRIYLLLTWITCFAWLITHNRRVMTIEINQ